VELLGGIVGGFEVKPSYAAELEDPSIGARRLCEVNAQRKAFSVAERFPDHWVLGADTLVFLDGHALAKPADLSEARAMLERLSGRVHEVITGVCLVHQAGAKAALFAEATRVKFHPLTPEGIGRYLEKVHTLDKAGGYAIQEHGDEIVAQVEGSYSNVVGLPVDSVRAALLNWGATAVG
jgi:septum formation protein